VLGLAKPGPIASDLRLDLVERRLGGDLLRAGLRQLEVPPPAATLAPAVAQSGPPLVTTLASVLLA